MPRVLKYGVIVLGSLTGLLLVAVIVAKLIPDDTYKGWLTGAVESATGRQLSIDGAFELDLGFQLRMYAEDITFANAEWGSQPNMYQAESLDVEVPLAPLLTGVIDLTVDHASLQLLLETNADGDGNWIASKVTDELAERDVKVETKEGSVVKIVPRSIHLSDSTFTYHDGVSGRTDRLVVEDLSVGGEQLSLDLQGSYNDAPTTLTARLGTLDELLRGERSDVDVKLVLGGVELVVPGPIADITASGGPTLDLNATLAIDSTNSLEPATQSELPDIGPINASAQLSGAAGAYALRELSAGIESEALSLGVTGTLADLVKLSGADVTLQADTTQLADLIAQFGVKLPVAAPPEVHVSGTLIGSKAKPGIRELKLRIKDERVDITLTGDAEDLLARSGIDAEFAASVESVSALSKYAGREPPALGPVELSSRIVSSDDAVAAQDLTLSVNDERLTATIGGSVGDLLHIGGIDLSVRGESTALDDLIAEFGLKSPVALPASARISAHVLGSKKSLAVHDLDAQVEDGQVQIKLSGAAEDIIAPSGISADIVASAGTLSALSKYAGRTLPDVGPVDLSGKVVSRGDGYAVQSLKLKSDDERLRALVQGQIADVLGLSGIELDVNISTTTLDAMIGDLGLELPVPLPSIAKVKGAVRGGKEALAIENLHLEVDGGQFQATLSGSAEDLIARTGIEADLSGSAETLAAFTEFAGRELPALGPIKLAARIGSSGGHITVTGLDLKLEDEKLAAGVQGQIEDLLHVTGVKLHATLESNALEAIAEAAGVTVPVPLPQSARIEATVTGNKDRMAISDLQASATDDRIEVTASGAVANVLGPEGVDVRVGATAESLAALSKFAGRELPDMGPLQLSGHVASSADGYGLDDLDVQLSDAALQAKVTGVVQNLLAAKGIALDASVKVASLKPLSALAGRDLPDTGPLTLKTHLAAPQGAGGPASLNAKLTHERITAAIAGSVANLRTVDGLNMEVDVDAPSVAKFAELAGIKIPARGPLKLSAKLGGTDGIIRFEPFELQIASSDLKGSATLSLSRELTSVAGELHSQHLNFRELKKPIAPREIEVVKKASKKEQQAMREAEETAQLLFSSNPLPTPLLPRLKLDVDLAVRQVTGLQYVARNVKARAKLDKGLLEISPIHAEIGGRPIDAKLRLGASRSPVSLDVDLLVDSIDVEDVSSADTFLQGGTIDASVNFSGRGQSAAEIMGSLNGEVAFAIKNSRIPDSIINSFGAGLIDSINPLKDRSGFTGLDCAAINVQIADGVATTPEGFAIQTTQVTWLGKGDVDLNTERLDVIFQPAPRKGLGLDLGGMARLIQLGGTLKKPKILLDPMGLTTKAAGIFAAISTGGVSLLVTGLFKKRQANQDVCEKILAGTKLQ